MCQATLFPSLLSRQLFSLRSGHFERLLHEDRTSAATSKPVLTSRLAATPRAAVAASETSSLSFLTSTPRRNGWNWKLRDKLLIKTARAYRHNCQYWPHSCQAVFLYVCFRWRPEDRQNTVSAEYRAHRAAMGSTATMNPDHVPFSEFYDSDEGIPKGSPIMAARQVILRPSLTPPPSIPLPPKLYSLPGSRRRKSDGRPILKPNPADRMLLEALDNGRNPDIPAVGAREALQSDVESDEENSIMSEYSESSAGSLSVVDEPQANGHDRDRQREAQNEDSMDHTVATVSPNFGNVDVFDLKSLAAGALQACAGTATTFAEPINAGPTPPVTEHDAASPEKQHHGLIPAPIAIRNDVRQPDERPFVATGAAASYMSPYSEDCSPRDQSHPLHTSMDMRSPIMLPNGKGELPPIQLNSPRSDTSGQTPLPSIKAQLGDLRQLHENAMDRDGNILNPPFQHSPPATFPRMVMPGHHGSPPISPAEAFHRNLPSPRHLVGQQPLAPAPPASSSSYSAYYQQNGLQRGPADFPHSNQPHNPDRGSSEAASIADRMSIDGLTTTGVYRCPWANCTAAPFQTQYLLNSHANVHSSARPHYCPVQGCPRSEGGKGFKRKNEMIRHGLVHESPGYVCPFCPDREHKYPRPDNLQRYDTFL